MPIENTRPASAQAVRCYAIRRSNPFLGVLQIIESGID